MYHEDWESKISLAMRSVESCSFLSLNSFGEMRERERVKEVLLLKMGAHGFEFAFVATNTIKLKYVVRVISLQKKILTDKVVHIRELHFFLPRR